MTGVQGPPAEIPDSVYPVHTLAWPFPCEITTLRGQSDEEEAQVLVDCRCLVLVRFQHRGRVSLVLALARHLSEPSFKFRPVGASWPSGARWIGGTYGPGT